VDFISADGVLRYSAFSWLAEPFSIDSAISGECIDSAVLTSPGMGQLAVGVGVFQGPPFGAVCHHDTDPVWARPSGCSIYAQPFRPCAVSIGKGFNDQHAAKTKTWGITAHQSGLLSGRFLRRWCYGRWRSANIAAAC
jgi:hypothetical protein